MTSAERIRARAIAYGRVQGVFFRVRCQDEAVRRDLSGWVTNRGDGAVEAVFEGPSDRVNALIEWMHHGPRHARVDRVDVIDEPVEGLADFRIV